MSDRRLPFQPFGLIVAPAQTIFFGPHLRPDYADAPRSVQAVFLHEMTHCAQAQAGMDLIPRGIGAHASARFLGRSAYAYDPSPAPLVGRPFEHQAAMVEDAWRMLGGLLPRHADARLPDLLAALGHADVLASRTASLSFGAPPLLRTPLR
ncbi:hypothetical protein [Parvularcula dongshanensis]|uniref:Vgr related protein n=1 Tax=Parvularcula dongshanensis TaxID=1173995 RepID=A0A840I4L4_9PROT|nr:hypothetical protein [Parvularcula dongshanensis]MBB4659727.1 hypothetical protein [Parvularcula dongshanensis]